MGFLDLLRGMCANQSNREADIIWRKFHGDVETLREIARGEHPSATSTGIKAAQNALEKHGYSW